MGDKQASRMGDKQASLMLAAKIIFSIFPFPVKKSQWD